MRRLVLLSCALVAALAFSGTAFAKSGQGLQLFTATVDAATADRLAQQGYDIAAVRPGFAAVEIDLVLAPGERGKLAHEGIKLRVKKDKQGRSQTQRAALQSEHGLNVYRSYDEPGGIRDEMYEIARRNPQLVKLEVLGESVQGREYIALKLTQGARGIADGSRPAVLYVATHHAREWISTEVNRRLLHWYIDQWRANNKDIKNLLKNTELWFVLVHNPDGYEYTFDVERLWRKNLRDNDGDGQTTNNDGVDLNRNYPEHWNYDEEGSSSQFSSETYRGVAPASEPETQVLMSLYERVPFRFSISYHSFGQLLLYPQGWQVQTPSADDPVYVALTGDDTNPAVEGFNPGVSADLYTTNGEYTDWAHGAEGTLAWTPELSEGCDGCGFVFPDDEALIQEEFEKNLDMAVRIARSALDPDDPVSHAGIDTQGFYLDVAEIDPWKTNNPASDLDVDVSYGGGASQAVEVLAKRSLGAVTLNYSINGGPAQTATASESPDGERFGGNNAYDVYYRYLRGEIPGIQVGDTVEYWFTGGGEASDHATFEVVEDADADVLVLAAEDRTGASSLPGYTSTDPGTANYLSSYETALTANGISFDVYDMDARGREAADHLGVLSHYDAVVWYTGNDVVTREAGWTPGNASRLANDLMLEARAYLNEGGKLLYTGQRAGATENGVHGGQFFDPVANEQCVVGGALVLDRCQFIADKNDFIQYYLGALLYNSGGGTDPDTGEPFAVEGVSDPYSGANWSFNGADSAQNQRHTASFLTTSSLLKPETYPQFASQAPAVWATGAAGSFEPVDGDWYVYSQRADISYKRLMRTISVPAGGATLTFRTSYDTEFDWDFLFVEAHTVSQDDWTTLPDANGHTNSDTGSSCPAGWFELHPWLERYQGSDCSGANPTTGGEWNAHSGRSDGWEEWQIDLSPYAGQQVEVAISYASDWAVQGLGAFVDDIQVSTGEGTTSFETGMDGWTVPGPAPGSNANPNDWERTQSVGFEEGAVVSTEDTLYFGFGFEGITDAATRADVMGRSMDYLLGP
ncbi:MAG: M14 family zinc carboxypeptidase [Gaiellaceae bacterium]